MENGWKTDAPSSPKKASCHPEHKPCASQGEVAPKGCTKGFVEALTAF